MGQGSYWRTVGLSFARCGAILAGSAAVALALISALKLPLREGFGGFAGMFPPAIALLLRDLHGAHLTHYGAERIEF